MNNLKEMGREEIEEDFDPSDVSDERLDEIVERNKKNK